MTMLVVFEMRYFTRRDLFSKNIYNIKTPGKIADVSGQVKHLQELKLSSCHISC
jgi:hypothetical protein